MQTAGLMTANQESSNLIRQVERGEGFVITRRDRPVANLVSQAGNKEADPRRAAAYWRMVARLEVGARLGGLRVVREDLYDR